MSEVDRFSEEFRKAFSAEAKRVIDEEREKAVRPWRYTCLWLAVSNVSAWLVIILLMVAR